MHWNIRAYRETDETAVCALWQQVFPDTPAHNRPQDDIRIKLKIQRELFLVACIDEHPIATIMAGFDGHRGWVYYLAVQAQYRRHGIGRALMQQAERGLQAMGCPKLNLMVRANNRAVVAFYEKLGYQIEDRVNLGKLLNDVQRND